MSKDENFEELYDYDPYEDHYECGCCTCCGCDCWMNEEEEVSE